ncbi:hypothetical protein ACTWP5_31255 [Streptomyces sp. 4N509B]|uniref:hypothetical protein n=1 Tax=Streptomyces sp. 4N509B TaxID=3457413 RepID=UPI003FD5423F
MYATATVVVPTAPDSTMASESHISLNFDVLLPLDSPSPLKSGGRVKTSKQEDASFESRQRSPSID